MKQSGYSQRARRNGAEHTASVVGWQQRHAEQVEQRRLQAVAAAQRIVQAEEQRKHKQRSGSIRDRLPGVAFAVGAYSAIMALGWWLTQGTGAVLVRGHYRAAAGQGYTIMFVYTAIPVIFALCSWSSARKRKRKVEQAKAFLIQQEKIQAFKDSQLRQH